jgi:hypothetical protein
MYQLTQLGSAVYRKRLENAEEQGPVHRLAALRRATRRAERAERRMRRAERRVSVLS